MYYELFGKFRKDFFIDTLKWSLHQKQGIEEDDFDTEQATYCLLILDKKAVAGWRAIPCNYPILTQKLYPELSKTVKAITSSEYLEITRFGALPIKYNDQNLSLINYAMMLRYGCKFRAQGLVAIVDLKHERYLRRLNLTTKRYAQPFELPSTEGNPISVVAGEIPLNLKNNTIQSWLSYGMNFKEIIDDTNVLRPERIPA
jgi:N-acyl-L-homoserine lactone synthetase